MEFSTSNSRENKVFSKILDLPKSFDFKTKDSFSADVFKSEKNDKN